MKITIKSDPNAIRRYAHIRPAPRLGVRVCSEQCPGTKHSCTLEKGHTGVHVAHGRFRRVVAVWDRHARIKEPKRVQKPDGKKSMGLEGRGRKGILDKVRGIRGLILPSSHVIEAVFLAAVFLGMVAWAIDMALRIMGSF